MSNIQKTLLVLILLLTFVLRIYQVTKVPPSLNWDEISIGYNAYSILKTGKDEWNRPYPLHFKSYGEYKLPVQIYASVPGIALFGLTDLGVRITPVVYGTITVFLTFLLGLAIFKNRKIALLASFLLAISPWHIHLTRASFEASFATMWISLAIWLLILGFNKSWFWILSVISFAISIYTYNSARGFVPIFLLLVGIIYAQKLMSKWRFILASVAVLVILLLPLVPFLLSGEAKARYKLVSIADDPGLIPRINENRGLSKLPDPFPRLIHNKISYISYYFLTNYLSHFSPQFLFINGAPHKQHHVQGLGQLYLIEAPFLLFGLYLLFIKRRQRLLESLPSSIRRFRWVLVAWILSAYIPVSLTQDSIPHALRTVIVLPSYQLITALGCFGAFSYLKSDYQKLFKPMLVVTSLALFISFSYYLYQYYLVYPVNYSRDWQYGYKQVVDYIQKNQSSYDKVIFTRHYGEPHMFTLFYSQYDPKKYQDNPSLNRFETYDWIRVLEFDNYYFPDLGDPGTRYEDIIRQYPDKKLLFVGKPGDFPDNKPLLLRVNFLNNQGAFEIVDNL